MRGNGGGDSEDGELGEEVEQDVEEHNEGGGGVGAGR